jgi:hypothetical protein
MAKRSVKRAREQGRAAPPPPPPTSATRSRQFWLGALAAACLLVPLAIVAIALAAREGDDGAPVAATPEASVQSEAERLQEIAQTRDKNQVQDLTAQMRGLSEALDPVLRGVARTLPPEDEKRTGPLATRRNVAAWIRATGDAEQAFAEAPSGDTGTNVARGAVATAVRGFAEMMRTYEFARARPQDRDALLARARAQRDNAMAAWETAAIQIDVINIAAGFGHQHPPAPGVGGAPPDDLPEGTGATDGG